MRLGPVLLGFCAGAAFCGCAGLLAGLVTGSGELMALADGAYLSDYEAGHAVGSLMAAPCCVGTTGGLLGALIGMLVGGKKGDVP